MRLAPRIARQYRADDILRLGFDGEDHALLIGERSAQDDKACVHEPVHEGGVRGPVGLLLHRPRRVLLRPRAANHDEEHRHARILSPGLAAMPSLGVHFLLVAP
jgi:hypothetical protein